MEKKDYVVFIDSIYVGEVVRSRRIYQEKGKLNITSWEPYRSILFMPDRLKLCDDLLYNSPHYPILNLTDNSTCINLPDDSVIIKGAYNLGDLLRYFGYWDAVTYKDILRIKKRFFTGRFAMDNPKLFGMREFIPDDFKPDLDENKRYEKYKETLTLDSERNFSLVDKGPLPYELFHILDERGNHSISEVVNMEYRHIDAFKPHKSEGKIKKLKNRT